MSKFTDLAIDYNNEEPVLTIAQDDIKSTLNKMKNKLTKISKWHTGDYYILDKNEHGRTHNFIIQVPGPNYSSELVIDMKNLEINMDGSSLTLPDFLVFVENEYITLIDARILQLQELKTE